MVLDRDEAGHFHIAISKEVSAFLALILLIGGFLLYLIYIQNIPNEINEIKADYKALREDHNKLLAKVDQIAIAPPSLRGSVDPHHPGSPVRQPGSGAQDHTDSLRLPTERGRTVATIPSTPNPVADQSAIAGEPDGPTAGLGGCIFGATVPVDQDVRVRLGDMFCDRSSRPAARVGAYRPGVGFEIYTPDGFFRQICKVNQPCKIVSGVTLVFDYPVGSVISVRAFAP